MTDKFFVGPEVEKTPAFSKKTLFVTGYQDTLAIEKQVHDNKVLHVSLHADSPAGDGNDWNAQITHFLDRKYFVTFSYPAYQHNFVSASLSAGVLQSRLFVPVPVVKLDSIETTHPNLTVKLVDPSVGVWCKHYSELIDSNRFTDNNEYERVAVSTTGATMVKSLETKVEPMASVLVAKPVEQTVETPRVEAPVNNAEVGLDVTPTTALKPDEEAVTEVAAAVIVDAIKTPADAAAAYAEGTKADPLSAEASKKPKAKK